MIGATGANPVPNRAHYIQEEHANMNLIETKSILLIRRFMVCAKLYFEPHVIIKNK